MSNKKTVSITVLISTIFVSANFMVARAYVPLVRIPGLPTTGEITLSQYIVGLYNFLLSVVGIVAVIMLIIGGIKYMTAVGNVSTISDAKDTIWNAVFGLLLALLSWVIVSTINPDVLYVKNPSSGLDLYLRDIGLCGTYDPGTGICTCMDGGTTAAADQDACEAACKPNNCRSGDPTPCIMLSESPDTNDNCTCIDGEVIPATSNDCNAVCAVGHCLAAGVRVGTIPGAIALTPDDYKEIAVYGGDATAPFVYNADKCLVYNKSDYSVVYNQPAIYATDDNLDGSCDYGIYVAATTPPTEGEIQCKTYNNIVASNYPMCRSSETPKGYTCEQKICIQDSSGNTAETVLFFTVLAP